MARTLALLLDLLSLTASASSETSPGSTATAQAILFTPAHADNRLFRSLTGGGAVHSTALACCKFGRQSLREYLHFAKQDLPRRSGMHV
jgi:hypothetical protein